MGKRIFTFSELFGQFPCEMDGCDNQASTVVLTEEENKSLPEEYGPKAARFILEKPLGRMVCDECFKKHPELNAE